jgi:ectoine hydroxylase-related dioxygenase (phytanoyl-CoA dioxygenase family)
MLLSVKEVGEFKANGFIAISEFIDSDTVSQLRDYYDRILRREIELPGDRMLGDVIRQVMIPSRSLDYFRANPALQSGKEIAAQVLGSDNVGFYFDMLISKQPGDHKETPWHQDFAYFLTPFTPAGTPIPNRVLQFWVALDEVDENNGCMQFIPAAHNEPLLGHYVSSGDPNADSRLLATDQVDASKAVACRLKAGGCTIHFPGTPHYTGGNTTADRPRRAYIFSYRLIPSPPK